MPMNSCEIQAHPSGPAKASGPFTSSSLHPTAWNTCGPILSKKDLRLLSSPAPPCPRLVPEGPRGTLSCNPCPLLQVPTGLSLLLRPLPQQGTGKLCVGPWPPGPSLPDLNSLPWPKQRTVGQSPSLVKKEDQPPTPHLQTLPRLPPESYPPILHPPVDRQPSLGPQPPSSVHPKAGLAWPLCVPVPWQGRASAGPQGSALQWAGRMAAEREAGRDDLAVS